MPKDTDEPQKKTGKLWQAILLAFLSGGGGTAMVLTIYDFRPDPHTGASDVSAMSRAEARKNEQIEELRKQIRALQADHKRHIEADGSHCQCE